MILRMEFMSVILAIGFLSSGPHGKEIDWCATLLHCLQVEERNTMCTYGEERENTGNCSEQKDLAQERPDIRNYWLALHNTFRDQIAGGFVAGLPPASDMLQLVWDDTLATQARRWAFQCKYEDDPCTKSPMYHNLEPEIIYNETRLLGNLLTDTRAAVLTRFLQDADGYSSFPVNIIRSIDGKSFQSYEQVDFVILAFARIREIGAALILYKWFEGGKFYPFFKSNTYFGPPILQGPVYTIGEPCSLCPQGYRCNKRSTYANLCAKPQDPTNDEYTDQLPGAFNARSVTANVHACSILLLTSTYLHFKAGVNIYYLK